MDFYEELKDGLGGRVRKNVPMNKYTSFATGGNADFFAEPVSEQELILIQNASKRYGIQLTLIGNGTNLLVSDEGIDGVVVSLRGLKEISVKENRLCAKCGNSMSEVSKAALAASLEGTEFMSGIPGSVGGGIYMNAGAYTGEIKDIATLVTALDENSNFITYEKDKLDFGYRESIFTKKNEIILSAEFTLTEGDPEKIRETMRSLNEKRREKQPLEYPSAGSTFKRPEGYYAAELIEKAGLKGRRAGGAMVSKKHSGFIINYENATTSDILELIAIVKDTVKEKYGVELATEVKTIGRNI